MLTRNQSPDVPFDRSVNPYRGCEHGCVYCYARPTHAWLGLSPGLDFETRLFHKPDAAAQLVRELARPGYRPDTLALGANTDPYQPVERRLGVTRSVLQVLHDCEHPVVVTTKSALVLRDLDLLVPHGRAAARRGPDLGDHPRSVPGPAAGAARGIAPASDRGDPVPGRSAGCRSGCWSRR